MKFQMSYGFIYHLRCLELHQVVCGDNSHKFLVANQDSKFQANRAISTYTCVWGEREGGRGRDKRQSDRQKENFKLVSPILSILFIMGISFSFERIFFSFFISHPFLQTNSFLFFSELKKYIYFCTKSGNKCQ